MAIVENTSSEIGDVIKIISEVPIIGLITLQDFYDSTIGETADKYFEKKFRYSIDGINYSDWVLLTPLNIQSVEVTPTDIFYIEYSYKRVGVDPSGTLTFTSNSLVAEQTTIECGNIYKDSIFAQFFPCYDIGVIRWCLNVTEKLYKPGIVAKYIERGRAGNLNREDEDYLAFWRAISCLFAIIVNYARVFENFTSYSKVLKEYIKQKGLYFCNDEEIEDLLFLMKNFYSEISLRGGQGIIKRKSDIKQIDGELLRLICIKECNEFLFTLTEPWKLGWCIGNSSPMYKGTYFQNQLIKGYEKTKNVEDLSKYPLINKEYIHHYGENQESESLSESISESFSQSESYSESCLTLDYKEEVILIDNVPFGNIAGIGVDKDFDKTKAIFINSKLDYEITFLIKQCYDISSSTSITFGCKCFDIDGNQIDLIQINNGIANNYFFTNKRLNKSNEYYFIRGIIYSKEQTLLTNIVDYILNIGYGINLQFPNNPKICSIIPYLILDNSLYIDASVKSNSTFIYDFKVRLLRTTYSTGFIQLNNFIQTWIRNNNISYSQQEIEDIMREYLIPYDSALKINILN